MSIVDSRSVNNIICG